MTSPEPRRILVVDADEQVSAFLTFKLRRARYEVLSLTSTVNALAAIREFRPHLIVSEMVLPELSGVDFLKRIRMNPETAHIPFIFLSGSRNVENKIIAHEMGAEAFFAKPIFVKVFVNRINDLFNELEFKKMLSPAEGQEFSGLLQNISVLDLLNIVHENRRVGVIELTAIAGGTARIHFADGAVVRIERNGADNARGEENLYAVLPWSEGSFRIAYREEDVEPNIAETFDRLLFNATRWLSDYQSEISEMPALDRRLHLRFSAFVEQLAKLPDSVGRLLRDIPDDGATVGDILEKGGDDRKRATEHLKKLLALGVLAESPATTEVALPHLPSWMPGGKGDDGDRPQAKQPVFAPSPALPGDFEPKRRSVTAVPPVVLPPPPPPPPPPSATHPHDEESALIDPLYEEQHDTVPTRRGTPLLPAAILIAVAAAGTAVWYFLFRPSVPDTPPPVSETLAVPDAAPVTPTPPEEKKDPYANKEADELLAMGAASHAAERYDEAIERYRMALTRLPEGQKTAAPLRARILKNLSIALYDSDAYLEAFEAVTASRGIGDDDPEKVELAAAILEEMKRFDDAMNIYRAALKEKVFKPQVRAWKKEIGRLKKEKRKVGGTP